MSKTKKIELLESTTPLHQNALEKLELTCDDNQQYSRQSCLRIHGIEFNSNEDSDIVMNKTGKSYGVMALEFNESEIDRANYIGKPPIDKNTKKKCKLIIAKFKSRKSRMAFYKTSPKSYDERKKKPGVKCNISSDLTKRR